MNTTETKDIRTLPVSDILVSVLNTRQPTKASVKELATSIAAVGQTTIGLGRPHPIEEGKIELAAGARRRMACEILEIPMVIEVRTIEDGEFEDIILVENLQREDPDVFQEAQLVEKRLLEGASIREIAGRYGKKTTWVRKLVKLLGVEPTIRKRFIAGEFPAVTLEVTEYLGTLPHEMQLEYVEDNDFAFLQTADELRNWVEPGSIELKGIEWMTDPRTFHNGCEAKCASQIEGDLFGGDAGPACVNRECFNERLEKWMGAIVKDHQDQYGKDNVILIANRAPIGCEEVIVVRSHDFSVRFKPTRRKADFMVAIQFDNKGTFKFVACLKKENVAKTTPGGEEDKPETTAAAELESFESRKKKLQARRYKRVHEKLIEFIHDEKNEWKPNASQVMRMVALIGTCGGRHSLAYGGDRFDIYEVIEGDSAKIPTFSHINPEKQESPKQVLIDDLRGGFLCRLNSHNNAPAKELIEEKWITEMTGAAKLFGFDIDACYAEIAQNIHIPKSWNRDDLDNITLELKVPAE